MTEPGYFPYMQCGNDYNNVIIINIIIIIIDPLYSGFWGLLCVGIFSKSCYIRELYEELCFCCSSALPDAVSLHNEVIVLLTVEPPLYCEHHWDRSKCPD